MTYSELRKQQEREMEDLLIERLEELEKFRKMNSVSWGQPDKYDVDIQRVQKFYATKALELRQQQESAQKAFLNEANEDTVDEAEPKDRSNPIDKSSINDRYDKNDSKEEHQHVTPKTEQKSEKKKFKYRRRMK
jgi:hypothetical protein